MERAKVINKGETQEIYLPQNCYFDTDEVWINKIGNVVMLIPKENKWESMISSLDMFTDDFLILFSLRENAKKKANSEKWNKHIKYLFSDSKRKQK